MNEEFLALFSVVIGALFVLIGVFGASRGSSSLRTNRTYRALQTELEYIQKMQSYCKDEALKQARVDPEWEQRRMETMEEFLLREERLREGLLKRIVEDTLRSDVGTRTVEVQRQDGSTIALGIDPSNADSVQGFLDHARRNQADRVVAVH